MPDEVGVPVVDPAVDELEGVDDLDPLRPTPRPTANPIIAISNNRINNQNVLFFNPHNRFSLILCGGGVSSTGSVLLRPVLYSFIR